MAEYIIGITADADKFLTRIVRCKDCRFGYISEFAPPEKRDIWCCARNHILATVKPDFFCGDGEVKDGEQSDQWRLGKDKEP